jgi:hypothetical protein
MEIVNARLLLYGARRWPPPGDDPDYAHVVDLAAVLTVFAALAVDQPLVAALLSAALIVRWLRPPSAG